MTGMRARALALGAALALVGAAAWRGRPARVRSARVTSVTEGPPALAHVSLAYSPGAPPPSLVVDVLDAGGAPLGSATVAGGRMLLEVPLQATAAGYRVRVTSAWRRPWGVVTRSVAG